MRLVDVQGTRRHYQRNASIPQLFALQAALTPDAPAVESAGQCLTYGRLERQSSELAAYLATLGVGPGAAVGVAFERSAHLPVALLGILKAGAAYVPLDPAYPRERLAFMCEDAAVGLAITAGAPGGNLPPALHCVDLLADAAAIAAAATGPNPARCAATSLAYVIYTSGSSGRPKGVAVEHRGVVRLVRGADYVEIAPGDAYLQFAPLAFDASTFEIWAPLLNGARLVMPQPGLLSMDELAETIDRFGVTTLFLTTSIFNRLVDTPSARPRALRQLFTGGEVASPAHFARFREAFPACRLIAVYGPTENTTFSTWHEIAQVAPDEPIPIGRPIANSSALVLDEDLRPVPPGAEGELCVGGDGVARGYLNLPEAAAARFVPDPFSNEPGARLYRTGDRARCRDDGVLEFRGRSDDQVKIRGFRIEPGEIEAALRTHAGVHAAAVVVAERGGEKALCAYAVAQSGERLDERELRAHLSARLPAYMLPQRIEVLPSLPAQPSGKVDRIALARRAANASAVSPGVAVAGGRVPGAATQRTVTEIWRSVLGAGADPAPDENFFDAGGDSLLLLSVHERLQRSLAVKLGVTDLFTHSTIRKQAALIDALRAG